MSEKTKDITNEVEKVENEEIEETKVVVDGQEVNITGGILLLRTEEGSIVYEKVDEVSWEDITMFSEYLNRLKDIVWDERVGVKKDEN